jgi:hypothetical protein
MTTKDGRNRADGGDDSDSGNGSNAGNAGGADERPAMAEVMRAVTSELSELLQSEPAGVSALKGTDQGWTAQVEVVEIPRIPDTTSVMASYRVDLDRRGRIVGYERTGRYARGRVER